MHSLEDPRFYYLANFHKALAWLAARYSDLFSREEADFLRLFAELPLPSQALLTRMVMRKGPHFRASKLRYEEIGCSRQASEALLGHGWITTDTELSLPELFNHLRKDEVLQHFGHLLSSRNVNKPQLLEQLESQLPGAQCFQQWCPQLDDPLLTLTIGELIDRLRLMFFGNLHQDWVEFVLSDLGIFRYEHVALSADTRGFTSRADIDTYFHLWQCRQRFEAGEPLAEILEQIAEVRTDNPLLLERRGKLLFRMGQYLERLGELEHALGIYAASAYVEARQRQIRVLERLARYEDAHALAQQATAAPVNDAEAQLVARALTRLNRQLGLAKAKKAPKVNAGLIELSLPFLPDCSVERRVQLHLSDEQAPVHYVENTLICSLFGLLCWPAIYAPLPGAFFHPFHTGPVDLLRADFRQRRASQFAECLALLESDAYKARIRTTYQEKFGIQSPFVFWGLLTEELLEQALTCLPAAHLQAWFQRLLGDIKANRAGMPDLIQFWPAEQRYRMIEVKGPGDRLQDNQKRWLAFCAEHGMPVDVCYVQWAIAQEGPGA
ncbi:MAG: VRR-NUC domain-containing protein [Pseudomonas sp.]|uniref:VRR-NUC domain-containing protein n=1 Tax=Pseudomonas sp. TaxID=306 RepID=UPI0030F1A075